MKLTCDTAQEKDSSSFHELGHSALTSSSDAASGARPNDVLLQLACENLGRSSVTNLIGQFLITRRSVACGRADIAH